MANSYQTPGVYVEEISKFPPSVAQVATAIPAFIGYTEKAVLKKEGDLLNTPFRIKSLLEYEQFFGTANPEKNITVEVTRNPAGEILKIYGEIDTTKRSNYLMYYSLRAFFANGGGPCWITSVGAYEETGNGTIGGDKLDVGLKEVAKIDEVTLLVFPDGPGMTTAINYYGVAKSAIDQCVLLQDRFTVIDVYNNPDETVDNNIKALRDFDFGPVDFAKYGAAYYPRLSTTYNYQFEDKDVTLIINGAEDKKLNEYEKEDNALYNQAKAAVNDIPLSLPPSSSVVGVYAQVDETRGVWKSPANVGINFVQKPEISISNKEQEDLNVDVNFGKSINAIRAFAGKGAGIIWGARTLAGNDNEWRYISVRRFFNMVEESVKKASNQFVFEPNDANTWIKVRAMIENFLSLQWRAGALQGATTEQAFYVKVGLNETMTALDILEGRMIVEIGMAVVRPAEFIILKFSHKMVEG